MKMTNIKLLKNPAVVKEIERYKWIESEKAGCDIGMEKATEEWLALHKAAWLKVHPPKRSATKTVLK